MDNLKALVLQNEFNLEQSKVMALVTQINARQANYLSPDKEAGLFLLFVMGKTLQEIAAETSYPIDIIYLTAIYYRWQQKAIGLGLTDADKSIEQIQKDILKSILVATAITTKKQLGDVIAGRDKSGSGLIPKNMQSLKQLMEAIEGLTPKAPEPSGTTITATNVQIVNNNDNWKPTFPAETDSQKAKRSVMIEAITSGVKPK